MYLILSKTAYNIITGHELIHYKLVIILPPRQIDNIIDIIFNYEVILNIEMTRK